MTGDGPVRVRFAPSPTGPLHLGNARVAVINHLFKLKFRLKTGGALILRIEDTDPERFDPSSEEMIHDGLRWLGIIPDEGPAAGGSFGPYRQGERGDIYRKTAEKLLKEGYCFKCFCTDEELEEERKRAATKGLPPRYSGRCRDLTEEEIRANEGRPFTIRFKVDDDPANRQIVVDDLIHKKIVFTTDAFGDFVILRADGTAVYNFSSAVDDHLMGITHVIRGEDHLPNTPRQVLIYRALGAEPPAFAHLPLLLSADGEKLKKRGGKDPNLKELRENGYTREAVVNYLASIGNPALNAADAFDAENIAEIFEIGRLGKSAVRVDMDKLKSINRRHIRGLGTEELAKMIAPFLGSEAADIADIYIDIADLEAFSTVIRENITLLTDAKIYAPVFFSDHPPIDGEAKNILANDDAKKVLGAFTTAIESVDGLTREGYGSAVKDSMGKVGIKGRNFFMPLRAALTGMTSGPELEAVAVFIGIERVRSRIARALKL